MVDIVTPEKRSQMMSGIRGKNTKPEILLRKALFSRGFRYRLHNSDLPGKPDMVLKKYNAAIFINGCFWHKHDCHLFKWPKTREEFWRNKIEGNHLRDIRNYVELAELGMRVMVIWECATKGKTRLSINELISTISDWLVSESERAELCGHKHN